MSLAGPEEAEPFLLSSEAINFPRKICFMKLVIYGSREQLGFVRHNVTLAKFSPLVLST
jgi:hypothetical protein